MSIGPFRVTGRGGMLVVVPAALKHRPRPHSGRGIGSGRTKSRNRQATRWQATQWPGCTSRYSGGTSKHGS